MTFKKPKRQVNKVYLHCSASDIKSHDNIETITHWHIDPKPPKGVKKGIGHGEGWKWVGYHYFIRKDGTIEEGRPLEEQPSAQGLFKGKYYNRGSIAICLSGRHIDLFRQEQFKALIELCKEIDLAYDKVTFHGHKEVSTKTCPVFDYKKVLDLDEESYIKPIRPLPTNLLTKTKNKMALPLLALLPILTKLGIKGATKVFDKLKGRALDKARDKIFSKILDKTGINLSDNPNSKEVESAVNNLPPEQLLELKKEIIESETELQKAEIENQTEQMAIVNKTMRAEMRSDDVFLKRARPTNIYCFAFSMTVFFVGFVGLSIYAVIMQNVAMIEMITKLVFSFLGIAAGWSAIVGVNINSRGREKIERIKRL